MASPNPNWTEIVTTSLQGYSRTLADNITNHNALLRRINRRGNRLTATGRSIVQELEYEENATVKWYAGYETLDTGASDVFTAAEYDYRQLAANVVISGLEKMQNSGREAIHNLLRSRIGNMRRSLNNTMATALYADGTGTDGKELGGLQLLLQSDGLGTVGGIPAANFAFWRNQNASTVMTTGDTVRTMQAMWVETIRGADRPDFITSNSTIFNQYWGALQAQERFVNEDEEASAGFMNLKFMSAEVFYDDQCPAGNQYFINTDYLFFRPARGRNFVPLGEKASINQDAIIMPMVWGGNMTTSNRERQGLITKTG